MLNYSSQNISFSSNNSSHNSEFSIDSENSESADIFEEDNN